MTSSLTYLVTCDVHGIITTPSAKAAGEMVTDHADCEALEMPDPELDDIESTMLNMDLVMGMLRSDHEISAFIQHLGGGNYAVVAGGETTVMCGPAYWDNNVEDGTYVASLSDLSLTATEDDTAPGVLTLSDLKRHLTEQDVARLIAGQVAAAPRPLSVVECLAITA